MQVSHVSEIPEDYQKALDEARTLPQLRRVVQEYREVAVDAVDAVNQMDDDAFVVWRGALAKERRGVFMGEALIDRFGPILMPAVMLQVAAVADRFKVPWGLAYIRLREAGRVTVKNGVATYHEQVTQHQRGDE